MVDLDSLDLEGVAAALDAEPEADIIGVDQLLLGAQEMDQGDLVEALLVGPVAGARDGLIERLGGLDDRLPLPGRDR